MTRKLRRECDKVMSEIKLMTDNPDSTFDNKIELYSELSDQMRVAAMKEIEARRYLTNIDNLIRVVEAGL